MQALLSPIRQRLKQATSQAHAALEARIGPLDTQSAYNEYVRGLHAFRAVAEAWLAHNDVSAFENWRPQRLAALLRQDANDLSLTPIAMTPVDWRANASFALGVHYVLEGSALGARILCKQVEPLGLHRFHGARHLWAQAESLEPWRRFLAHIESRGEEINEERTIAGANAAFIAAADAMGRAAND